MRFTDKVALVTGGGSGQGAATCLAFAKEGANVAILDINIENAEKIATNVRSMGRKAIALKADVANFSEVNASVEKVYDEFKHIDILINGAGYGRYVPFAELSEEVWDRSIAVHLKGTFNCTRAVINGMIAQRSGKIVSISSVGAFWGTPNHAHYSAAKAGVIGMSKSLAREVAPHGINVNCLAPGPIKTAFHDAMKKDVPGLFESIIKSTPLNRMGTAEEIAAIVLFLCSEEASFITGQVIHPNGGMYM